VVIEILMDTTKNSLKVGLWDLILLVLLVMKHVWIVQQILIVTGMNQADHKVALIVGMEAITEYGMQVE
tara:strand:+ start:32 stop:238 length:207 start_codon:yes stop_codon:yes gene_type:complete